MIVWCRIHGTPVRQFGIDARALPFMDSKQAKHLLLTDAGALKHSSAGDNASITLMFNNKSGQCTALFADPPLAAKVEIFGDAVLQFEGSASDIALTADCRIQVQA